MCPYVQDLCRALLAFIAGPGTALARVERPGLQDSHEFTWMGGSGGGWVESGEEQKTDLVDEVLCPRWN